MLVLQPDYGAQYARQVERDFGAHTGDTAKLAQGTHAHVDMVTPVRQGHRVDSGVDDFDDEPGPPVEDGVLGDGERHGVLATHSSQTGGPSRKRSVLCGFRRRLERRQN